MRRSEREKEKLKSKLARAEKMEALGVLAGGIAHDLNNVLSGIVSYPELLLLDLPEESPLRKPILTIKDSGIKAAAIVQDLLTLARRDVATKEVVNLNEVIDDYLHSAEYAKMMTYHPEVHLQFEAAPDLLNILGSPFNLSKAIMNLLTNAAEATKGGGKIQIVTRNSYLEQTVKGYKTLPEGDYVRVTITDTGVGIPKKDLERIFEPFYSKKVMGRSGTGLGMTVVWGTMIDHNGHIDVQSEEGKGTQFSLVFPATRRTSQKKQPGRPVSELMGNGESILVVDDVQEQRDLASDMLRRLGYQTHVAANGEAAVAFFKANNRADLLLLDMIMPPGIDGFETYRQIREITPDQKGIIVSGFSETDRVKKAQSLGTGAYIQKPYLLEQLGSAVKKELGRKPAWAR
jgi:nitrogen-specific signal transduction histidine kinase/ActR/RegA family two-component response regulator